MLCYFKESRYYAASVFDYLNMPQYIHAFKQQVEALAGEVESIELRSRRKMLLFYGVVEQKNKDESQLVVDLYSYILSWPDITVDDIRRCRSMGCTAL